MIRILHIVTYMGRGGLETMLMNYYRKIDRSQIQFDFLVHRSEEADYDQEILSLGGKIYHVSRLVPWSRSYKAELKAFFKSHPEYQIVHVHQDCLSSVALKCAKECGIPVRIAHSHAASQNKNIKYLIKMFYKQFIPTYATDLMACGEAAGAWMFSGNDFSILKNAIPARKYIFNEETRSYVKSSLGLNDKNFTIGLVANFTPPKNHKFLLEIFDELQRLEPNARLLLVGGGPLEDSIVKQVHEKGLEDKVILTGIRKDVPDLLQAMDAFVMTSFYEGLSLAIIEAQTSGLPCFVSDKVSIECKKTDLVYQIGINESAKVWAHTILESKGTKRISKYKEIAEAGFDVEQNASWLQKFYMEKLQ